MSLATALTTGPAPDTRRKCGACDWQDTLDAEAVIALKSLTPLALAQEQGWNASRLWEECQEDGQPLQYAAFLNHLKGKCSGGTR
jgi:hypothetical protein